MLRMKILVHCLFCLFSFFGLVAFIHLFFILSIKELELEEEEPVAVSKERLEMERERHEWERFRMHTFIRQEIRAGRGAFIPEHLAKEEYDAVKRLGKWASP